MMSEQIGDGRVVLVTGAARGLGASIARLLATRGHVVAINARPGGTDPGKTIAAVEASGGRCASFVADVFQPESARQLVADVEGRFGRLDGIVLTATPSITGIPFLETRDQDLDSYLRAYVAGPFALIQAAVPGMTVRRHGRIVALLTSALSEVPPRMSAYIAAKSGLLGLCRALSVELGPFGIAVNCVSPGALDRPGAEESERARASLAARSYPMRRLGSPDEVAEAVAFLLSDAAAYVSGAHLAVTGGRPL